MTFIPAGSNLQEALNAASPGDVLDLEPGAVFSGMYVLPTNTSGTPITLTGAATLVSTGASQPAIKTGPQANDWHLRGQPDKPLTFRSLGVSEIIRLGESANSSGEGQTLEEMPRGFRLEYLHVEGNATNGAQRGISLQCGEAYVGHCRILNIRARNTESQGICGWNGTGPWVIEDNEIQAGGMPFMAGGGPTSIPDVIPSRITFRRNHCWRPLEWRDQPYACKNLFELKNGRDVVVENNLFENCWDQGQRFAVALTPRVSTTTPWASVLGVRIRHNRFIHIPGGVNLLGSDTNNTGSVGKCDDIVIEDNEFLDVMKTWGGHATFIQFVRGNKQGPNWIVPTNVTIRRNIVENQGAGVFVDSGPKDDRTPIPGVTLIGNEIQNGQIRGNGVSTSADTVELYLPDSLIADNRFAAESAGRLPWNLYYETAEDLQREYMAWPAYANLALRPSAAVLPAARLRDFGRRWLA